MQPSIEQMRDVVSREYNRPNWQEKVSKMSDAQVIAIHTKLVNKKLRTN